VHHYEGIDTSESRQERERVAARELPPRYGEPWGRTFFSLARPALHPGVVILDVGGGRQPTLPRDARPEGARYVGLDISRLELEAAAPKAYDDIVVSDIGDRLHELEDRFDLVLSWQTLEHVHSVERALDNIHAYLRPGGRFVAQLSGSYSAFALLARAIPYPLANRLMKHLMDARHDEKFPTRYDRCTASALEPVLQRWSQHGIVPRYKAGAYFRFFRPLERTYIAYENWAERSGRKNLATHYVIWAVR
jgi:SAM-dependent methyltransferase